MKRCDWVSGDIHTKYHDTEWGTPLHNDCKLFEFLILDACSQDSQQKERCRGGYGSVLQGARERAKVSWQCGNTEDSKQGGRFRILC